MLLKAKQEYERKKANIKQYYLDSDCYKNQTVDLFSLFKSDECLSGKIISETSREDMLFLIDPDTLLRIYSFDINKVYIVVIHFIAIIIGRIKMHLDYSITEV